MDHSITQVYKNIKLVPLNEKYSEQYRILRNHPDIGKWFMYNNRISAVQQKEWYSNYLGKEDDIMFAILDAKGTFLGCNSIYSINMTLKMAEYGRLIIDPKESGKDYGYQATLAAAFVAKKELKLSKLNLEVYSDNLAAIKTYHRVGYVDTGVISDSYNRKMTTMEINLNIIQ